MLHNKLTFLFPNYREGDWELQDDGSGAYIAKWNRPEPQPTLAQIDAVGDVPQPAPRVVTMRQARLALLNAGFLAAVNDAFAAMQGDEGTAARIEWEYSQEVRRDTALVSALASALGLSNAQLNALFVSASQL